MPIGDIADDLWVGMLAAQTGLVAPEAVLAAARSIDAAESLDDALIRLGALTSEDRSLLHALRERLVQRNIACQPDGWSSELQASLLAARERESAAASTDANLPSAVTETLPLPTPSDSALCDTIAPTRELPRPTFPAAPTPSGTSRFHIIRLHARGGIGQVSVAIDEELRREVALKEIQSPYADDLTARARFVQEAEITGSLEHPGIVPVYGLGVSSDGRPYYAMRFIQGRSMLEALEEYHHERQSPNSETAFKFRALLRRFIDMCQAVEYAHSRGIIHRDLKPGNVMLGTYGETLVVDWGLAKPVDKLEEDHPASGPRPLSGGSSVETQHGSALGTPHYMSPEQASGDWAAVDRRSDVYSLGATLYHLLTGKPAFTDPDVYEVLYQVRKGTFPPPRTALATVPLPLEAICLKAMALRPDERYACGIL